MVPMTATPLVNLAALIDDVKCFALVRQHRWPDGVRCPSCGSAAVARHGRDETQPHRQRYRCTACGSRFDDLTGTALAGHHRPLRLWVLCLYLMGLNLSNRQIAHELGLSGSDVQAMTEHLRSGLVAKTPAVVLDGTVEVYVVAGHKGHPAAVAKKAAAGGGVGSRAHPVAARWRKRNRQSWG
jgi:transposase-like protein